MPQRITAAPGVTNLRAPSAVSADAPGLWSLRA